ncbi:hypothetical protein J6590_071786 [Homalodisca vitripennis]|nr:hypothetical protein J6590_071786 [Homalodisca vitripennis]
MDRYSVFPCNRVIAAGVAQGWSGALSLRIQIHRTTTYNRSFTVTVCKLWNSLLDSVKQIESRERFVAELRRRYLDRMIVAGGGTTL